MGKFAYKMKNLFKSKEQIELEARMQFNQNKRSFTKYYRDLDTSIKSFSKMATEAEMSGNHQNALSCVKFVLKLQKTQTRVQGLLQRFEMMYAMQKLSGVMSNFMEASAEMGFNMDANIDLKSMWKNTAAMDQALSKLDAMSEQMEMVFDTIDTGMGETSSEMQAQGDADAEAGEMLDRIMGRLNAINTPAAQQAAPDAASADADDTDERLRKMMQELRD